MKGTVWLTLMGAIVVLTPPAAAQCYTCDPGTEVGGLIVQDTTWYYADSPYVVTSSIVVGFDATLTIEPGVEVRFKHGLGMSIGYAGFGAGTLLARGTEELPICFTTNDPCEDSPDPADPGDWGQVFFDDDAVDAEYDGGGNYVSGCVMEYVTVEYSGSAGHAIRAANSALYVAHCAVRHNQQAGISVTSDGAGDLKIEFCDVHDNGGSGIGVDATGAGAVTIDSCQVYNHPSGRGIGVTASATWPARVENCEVYNCTTSGYGAGISLGSGADHTVSGNYVHDCAASMDGNNYGGGIYINARTTLDGNVVADNSLTGTYNDYVHGGGIYLSGNSDGSTLTNNEVTGNTAYGHGRVSYGGGVFLDGCASCTLTSNTVSGNWVYGYGGGVCLRDSPYCELTGNTVTGNSTYGNGGRGGGITLHNSDESTLTDNTVTDNWTTGNDAYGGGICLYDSGKCLLTGSTVTDNSTSGQNAHGGGIYLYNSGTTTDPDMGLRLNTVSGNTTTGSGSRGGGICLQSSGSSPLVSNLITNNHASGTNGDGGGICLSSSTWCPVTDNTITYNTCADAGAGIILLSSGNCTLKWNAIVHNTCANRGGGIYFSSSNNCTVTECGVKSNHVTAGDTGGIFVTDTTNDADKPLLAGDPDTDSFNVICCNDAYDVYDNNAAGGTGNDIAATYVRWCTDDTGEIQDMIYDYFDDSSKAVVFWYPFAPFTLGDMNCDGAVNGFDIDPFVLALQYPEQYDVEYYLCCLSHADINGDGLVNGFDIDDFVQLLIGD